MKNSTLLVAILVTVLLACSTGCNNPTGNDPGSTAFVGIADRMYEMYDSLAGTALAQIIVQSDTSFTRQIAYNGNSYNMLVRHYTDGWSYAFTPSLAATNPIILCMPPKSDTTEATFMLRQDYTNDWERNRNATVIYDTTTSEQRFLQRVKVIFNDDHVAEYTYAKGIGLIEYKVNDVVVQKLIK